MRTYKKAPRNVYPRAPRSMNEIRAWFLKHPWFRGKDIMPDADYVALRERTLEMQPKRQACISAFIDGWEEATK